jgi:6-pyruvoyltetrahydropterin/6-carboxytetrahydropterin synthase
MQLTRIVRLAEPARQATAQAAGWRSDAGLVVPVEVELHVDGTPDPVTGYVIDIHAVDGAVRSAWSECRAGNGDGWRSAAAGLASLVACIGRKLPHATLHASLRQHPFMSWEHDSTMPNHATLVQRFDFAASHRLHCRELPDQENRRIFGKCNNPAGHGHNYRLEVHARVPLGSGPSLQPDQLERLVMEHAVDRLDHKHLNTDVPEFASRNPSVEWIAQTCFEWLDGPIRSTGAQLLRVRVWETEKTSAIYPG